MALEPVYGTGPRCTHFEAARARARDPYTLGPPSSLGRPAVVEAHDPDDVRLGASNSSTSPTRFTTTNIGDGAAIIATGAGSYSAITGISSSGTGIYGSSSSSHGVIGQSSLNTSNAVYGQHLAGGYRVTGRSSAGPLVGGAGAAASLGDNTANGIGVCARSAPGIALYADPANADAVTINAN